jgi:hypothetical protein
MDTKEKTLFGLPIDQEAARVAKAFAIAVSRRQEDLARAQCIDGAWDAESVGLGRLFSQCVRKGLHLETLLVGGIIDGRALVRVLIHATGKERAPTDMWFLLQKGRSGWRLAAATKSRPYVGLFLNKTINPPVSIEPDSDFALPEGEGLLAMTERLLAAPCEFEELEQAKLSGAVCFKESVVLSTRGAALLELDDGRLWVLANMEHGAWVPFKVSRSLSVEGLVAGLEVPWGLPPKVVSSTPKPRKPRTKLAIVPNPASRNISTSDNLRPTSGSPLEGNSMSNDNDTPQNGEQQAFKANPEQAAAMLKIFGDMMKQMGAKPSEGSGGTTHTMSGQASEGVSEAMLSLFQAAISNAQQSNSNAASTETAGDDSNVVDLEAERVKREPSELETKLQETVKTTFTEYVQDQVAADGQEEVDIDADFMATHGPAIFGNMLSSVFTSIIPDDLKVSIPTGVPVSGGNKKDAKKDVKLNVDLGALFSKFLPPANDPK